MKTLQTPLIKVDRKFALKALPLVAALSVASIHSASAILTWDLRAVSVISDGVSTPVANPKNVVIPGNSDVVATDIVFELWAVVTGLDANVNETLTSGQGTILSSPGTSANRDTGVAGNLALGLLVNATSVKGNLSNALFNGSAQGGPNWGAASTANPGAVVDLDGDGDLDIGSATVNAATGIYMVANTGGGAQSSGAAGAFNALTNGREWKLSIATFRVTGLTLGAASMGAINFVVPSISTSLDLGRASFATDGVTRNGADAQLAVAAPVLISVPEPSAFGMVLLGAMGLVGFRRMGLRRA